MDVAVNQKTNSVYATNVTLGTPFAGDTVYVIDGATCDAADTSGCGAAPATVRLAPPIFGDANPFAVAVDEDTNTVYTANIADGDDAAGTVSVINGATCNGRDTTGCAQTPATAPAGFGTIDIAVDPTTHKIHTANIQDTSVTTIDANTCRGTLTTGCAHTQTRAVVGDYPLGGHRRSNGQDHLRRGQRGHIRDRLGRRRRRRQSSVAEQLSVPRTREHPGPGPWITTHTPTIR